MTPTALPIVLSTTPATPVASASGAQSVASADFLSMLGQLLGAPVAASATTTSLDTAPGEAGAESGTAETPDSEALSAMLPTALLTPWNPPASAPVPVKVASDAASSMDLVALVSDSLSGRVSSAVMDVAAEAFAVPQTTDGAASMAATLNASAPSPADALQNARTGAGSETAMRTLHSPVGSSQWSDELGTRLTWMTERGQQSASLRLSPEHLGPLEVRISIRDDQASVWFGAAHADTRSAIEQALPRLRELFASQGLSLADAGVFHEAPRDRAHLPANAGSRDPLGGDAEEAVAVGRVRLGLIDAYA